MTSVDSGVETSNDSSDSCVTHDTKANEISPIKVSDSGVTNVNILGNVCPMNTSSSSSVSAKEQDYEKNLCRHVQKPEVPLDMEPPAGISFCNVQRVWFGRGYEIIKNDFVKRSLSLPVYEPSDLKRKIGSRVKRSCRKSFRASWLSFKEPLDERKLRYAASTNNDEQVEALLNFGVNPNCYDDQNRTPLHLSACRGYSNVVRLLLEKGANPNQRDLLGNTPLHLAACTNHVEVVTLLLKAGTDITSSDFYGRNPLQLAQSKLKLLQKGSNNEDSWKIKQEVQKVIEMMLTFLHKKGQDTEAELLNAFQTRLTLSQTKEEVETDVHDLLASLSNLNLNKSET